MSGPAAPGVDIRPVEDDQWPVVAWLWQVFRHDLAMIVHGLPYADGRYQARLIEDCPSPDQAGYLAWRPHPNTGEDAPIGFAVIGGLAGERRSIDGFWVSPVVRREGIGRLLALDVIARHDGPWLIGYQHDNTEAVAFWPRIADAAFGPGRWVERRQPVPRENAPDDHLIETLPALS